MDEQALSEVSHHEKKASRLAEITLAFLLLDPDGLWGHSPLVLIPFKKNSWLYNIQHC